MEHLSKAEEFLLHSGVKGMKWGVWNEETRRKYAGGSGRKASTAKKKTSNKFVKTASAVGSAVGRVAGKAAKAGVNKAKDRIVKSRETKKFIKENTKDATRRGQKEFLALRKQTLRSHDPATVAKGLHTLTNSELQLKIDRLKQEQVIRDLANTQLQSRESLRKSRADADKARHDSRAASIPGRLALTAGGAVAKSVGDTAKAAGERLVKTYLGDLEEENKK